LKIIVVGSAQDGGFPQYDCNCLNCSLCRKGLLKPLYRSSIAVIDDDNHVIFLDASPDMRLQMASIDVCREKLNRSMNNRVSPIDAIVVTHAHWGHIGGLAELGAGIPYKVPVYCSSLVSKMISKSGIYGHLVEAGYLKPQIFESRKEIPIYSWRGEPTMLKLKVLKVKHREDFTDTFGLKIYSSSFSVAYIPDIAFFNIEIEEFISDVDVLFFEGTFYYNNELEIVSGIHKTSYDLGHIPIVDSLNFLSKVEIPQKYYIHFNHTNPVLRKSSEEFKSILRFKLKAAYDGLTIDV